MAVRWGILLVMVYCPCRKYSLGPNEAVLCLTFISHAMPSARDPFSFRYVDDTPRQTISIWYERNTIDSSIEPYTEDEFCCKRADVVLCCVALPKLSVCAAYCFFSFPVFWTRRCVCNEDSGCQCLPLCSVVAELFRLYKHILYRLGYILHRQPFVSP